MLIGLVAFIASASLKARVAFSMGLLVGAKALGVQVPFFFKDAGTIYYDASLLRNDAHMHACMI